MLLMKDRGFLYELRAYLIFGKVGENAFPMSAVTSNFVDFSSLFHFMTMHRPASAEFLL